MVSDNIQVWIDEKGNEISLNDTPIANAMAERRGWKLKGDKNETQKSKKNEDSKEEEVTVPKKKVTKKKTRFKKKA